MMSKTPKPTNIHIFKNSDKKPLRNKIFIATPTLGPIRVEWAAARWGQVIPCNWSAGFGNIKYTESFPMGWRVAEAQNIAAQTAVQNNFEWLFLHEDDVVLPPDCYSKLNIYMRDCKVPVVSGLYYLKATPTEPLVYKGRGNSCFDHFKIGDKVWVDGVPTGCLLIHTSLLKLMWDESETYQASTGMTIKRIFETPAKVWQDPETGLYRSAVGTSDLYWCDRVMKENVLKRAGWKDIARKEYPFLLDSSIFCGHIDFTSGTIYPPQWR
jgi:hypothetical protein